MVGDLKMIDRVIKLMFEQLKAQKSLKVTPAEFARMILLRRKIASERGAGKSKKSSRR